MMYFLLIIAFFSLLVSVFCLFAVWRLFKYMKYIIEDNVDSQEEKLDNVINTLRIIVSEKLIKTNGRIQKPYLTKNEDI